MGKVFMSTSTVLSGASDEEHRRRCFPVCVHTIGHLVRYDAELSTGRLMLNSLIKVLPHKLGPPRHPDAAVDSKSMRDSPLSHQEVQRFKVQYSR